ncbi:hypothetical protein WH8501_26865 [Crocosphaera watsonii WH 8501]|uniref:Uncharacterized protein n=7 Tax=Crocosphaera watsonii TaxID=263511 RepID=Q4C7X9_CROWT|nr:MULTISPECIES: hypothetical protein [Crocosphaera]EAM52492.1 hypothetical protein CwatDRAFT_5751 [Crocosphaera watsonii WH 8501]MCH2244024.1 hypothetical protein [Crocosphaera sp.]NQZ61603.1 hypothetical protein [Crocosphaera sp.]CCQ53102.1 FIG00568834: hypothetical protein [Crocosphaera watsonii WH 8502]CCQ62524.1 hypothetical protein CWATWH0401_4223 [Crocosphaera watsonii WH 0401]
MSQFPKDDRELISFLQQYRPLPPPADSDLEKQIYLRVSHESQHRKYSRLRWLVPSIITTSILGIWGAYNLIKPSEYEQFVHQSETIETAETEIFMISTWEETINTSPWENSNQSVYYQWISADNIGNQYLISQP